MTEESASVKKGRGRPRKSETGAKPTPEKKKPVKETVELPPESAEETTETEEDVPPPSSAKKKRPAADADQGDKSEPAPKRGRGRPRKANKVIKVPSGRGRGRPRKNP